MAFFPYNEQAVSVNCSKLQITNKDLKNTDSCFASQSFNKIRSKRLTSLGTSFDKSNSSDDDCSHVEASKQVQNLSNSSRKIPFSIDSILSKQISPSKEIAPETEASFFSSHAKSRTPSEDKRIYSQSHDVAHLGSTLTPNFSNQYSHNYSEDNATNLMLPNTGLGCYSLQNAMAVSHMAQAYYFQCAAQRSSFHPPKDNLGVFNTYPTSSLAPPASNFINHSLTFINQSINFPSSSSDQNAENAQHGDQQSLAKGKYGSTEQLHSFSSSPSKPLKTKRNRTIFTVQQLDRLEEEFLTKQYMVGSDRSELARQLNLNEGQVKVWFQNRRIKMRKQKHPVERYSMSLNNPSCGLDSTFSKLREEAESSKYR